jgi:MFS family permease
VTRRRIVTYALLGCAFLALLDGTVIGTALPRIVRTVGGGENAYLWLVTVYLITSSVSVPVYGRCSDLYGRKRLLVAGLTIFLAGSLACGAAGDLAVLVVARAVQGLGAGALLALGMALVRDLHRDDTAAVRMQTAMSALMLAGLLGGPVAGGLITDHAGWRWTFWINLPIGVAALAVVVALLPDDRPVGADRPALDRPGIALLTGGLTLLLLPLSLHRYFWLLPLAAALLAALPFAERRAAAPILPPHLLRRRDYAALLTAGFWFQAAALPLGVFLPLYLQNTRHFTATASALVLLPMLAGMAIGNRVTAAVVVRTGGTRRILLVGAILLTAGAAVLLALPPDAAPPWLGAAALAAGLGLGPAMGGLTIATQRSVPGADMGSATAALILTKQLDGAVGLSVAPLLSRPALPTAAWMGTLAGALALTALLFTRDSAARGGAVHVQSHDPEAFESPERHQVFRSAR